MNWRTVRCLAVCTLGAATGAGCSRVELQEAELTTQSSGTVERLQAISIVDESVVWASGVGGTVLRTIDGGAEWTGITVPESDSLQFRDIDAIDADTAYLLSSGGGGSSRIYKTTDAGLSWTLQLTNPDASGFFDCMAFWDSRHGAVYGDAVDGSIVVFTTVDGESWIRAPDTALPEALPGEGGFAASGTCLFTLGDSTGWIGTGASTTARVLKTTDRGLTWDAHDTPIEIGSGASGITTLGFHDSLNGVCAGGDISSPDTHTGNIAVTSDGGETWTLAGRPEFPGAVYGLAVVPSAPMPAVVAVGPGGADYSLDNGETWTSLDSLEYWSVGFANQRTGWAVGPEGRITKIVLHLPSGGDEVN